MRARGAGRGTRARTLLVALVCAALVLTGCARIPTDGGVEEGDVEVEEGGGIDVLAEGPQAGAGPEEIVQGFLLAGAAGFSDDFVVARQYLAGDARSSWVPLAGVVVAGTLDLALTSEAEVTVAVPVSARVDADGRYAEAAVGASEQTTYGLVQDADGQWRISSAPDGLILSRPVFEQQFRAANVYFLSPDQTFLVPEPRWFPERNLASAVVQALLAGPSPWLRDAVTTAVPDGTRLVANAVQVDDAGVAEVALIPAPPVLAADRALLLAQLEASLSVPRVGSVRVLAGAVELEVDEPATLERGVAASGSVELLQDGELVTLTGSTTEPVEGAPAADGVDLRAPARSEDGTVRVALDDEGLVALPVDEDAEPLLRGQDLVPPSVDRFGWAWTARSGAADPLAGAGPGTLLAVAGDGTTTTLPADWLADRTVRSVRVARDGTRVAVVSAGTDGVVLEVAGIQRDAAGEPQAVGDPSRIGTALVDATAVVWVDATTVAVIGRSTGAEAVHLVPLAGQTRAQPELADVASLAAGRGERNILVATDDGALLRLDGPTWVAVQGVEDALDPYYPG